MKKLILTPLTVMLLTACARRAVYVNITAEEAKEIMDSEEGYIILDVRTQEEYAEGHIPGGVLFPLDDIEDKAHVVLPDKDQLILVYCRSGRRKFW